MAEGYDTEKRVKRAVRIADEIRTFIVDGHKKSAIEYGCGTGLVGLQLRDVFRQLTLIDSSSEMIKQVKTKLGKIDCPNIEVLCCDLMVNMPVNLKADYIFSSLVMHHIINTREFLTRLHSLLNNGGHIILVDLDKEDGSFHAKYPEFSGHNGYEHMDIISLAKDAGFSKINIKTFYHDTKIFNGKEKPYSLFALAAGK